MSDKRTQTQEKQASATRVWLILWKAARAVEQNALASVAALGLGLSDFAVLEALLHLGPLPVNVIGRKVMLTSGSITTAIHRLEARTLVCRVPHPGDGRTQVIQLTRNGKHTIQNAFRQHSLDMEETMAALSPEERIELTCLLKKMGLFAAARLDSIT